MKTYLDAIEDCQRHHASSKTFSGQLVVPHAETVKELIGRHEVRSILDYGCGKGLQYADHATSLEAHWGVPVTKYDPAWPPYADEPVGTFDMVICTHVLEWIPPSDVGWVIDRIYSLAIKAVFIAEILGEPKKRILRDQAPRPSLNEWLDLLRRPSSVPIYLSVKKPDDSTFQLIEV